MRNKKSKKMSFMDSKEEIKPKVESEFMGQETETVPDEPIAPVFQYEVRTVYKDRLIGTYDTIFAAAKANGISVKSATIALTNGTRSCGTKYVKQITR